MHYVRINKADSHLWQAAVCRVSGLSLERRAVLKDKLKPQDMSKWRDPYQIALHSMLSEDKLPSASANTRHDVKKGDPIAVLSAMKMVSILHFQSPFLSSLENEY